MQNHKIHKQKRTHFFVMQILAMLNRQLWSQSEKFCEYSTLSHTQKNITFLNLTFLKDEMNGRQRKDKRNDEVPKAKWRIFCISASSVNVCSAIKTSQASVRFHLALQIFSYKPRTFPKKIKFRRDLPAGGVFTL